MNNRMQPPARKEQILNSALSLAAASGYTNITREGIALNADCSPALVSKYLGTMINLRRAVMRAAVKQNILAVIAQGLSNNDPQARKATDDQKQKAAALLVK